MPYIPPVDPILDTVKNTSGTKNYKVSLPDGTIVYHTVYNNGSNEAFLIHVKEVLSFCEQKNYNKFYEKALSSKEDCSLRFKVAQKKSNVAIADPTTTPERAKALKKSLELAAAAVVVAEKTVLKSGRAFFSPLRDAFRRKFPSEVLQDCEHSNWGNALDGSTRECAEYCPRAFGRLF